MVVVLAISETGTMSSVVGCVCGVLRFSSMLNTCRSWVAAVGRVEMVKSCPWSRAFELPAEGVAGPIGLGQSGGLEASQADEVDRHAAIELRLEGEGPCCASIVGDGGCAARLGLRLAAETGPGA